MFLVNFYKEVRAEVLKVSWPTRKEVMMAVGLVLFLAALAGVFFLIVDAVLLKIVDFVLGV